MKKLQTTSIPYDKNYEILIEIFDPATRLIKTHQHICSLVSVEKSDTPYNRVSIFCNHGEMPVMSKHYAFVTATEVRALNNFQYQ